MKQLHLFTFLCLLSIMAFADRPMALVIMLDGQRADSIENLYMPTLQALRAGKWQPGYNCAWSDSALTIPDARPSSAANHTAIATGVTATKHNVFNNSEFQKGKYDEWPTWLTRLKKAKPEMKTLFMYSWKPDEQLGPVEGVEFRHGSDVNNGQELAARLATAEAPDATLLFIDIPDSGGHGTGFYPYGTMYRRYSYITDGIIKGLLDAIAKRPTFQSEDWLIVVTADHGGYAKSHGMWGGQATTIPFLVASKHVQNGRLAGVPGNLDAAPTALDHFGLYSKELNLDGVPRGKELAKDQPRPLKEGLAAYFTFDEKKEPVNHAGTEIVAKLFGEKTTSAEKRDGFAMGYLHVESDVKTEEVEENGVKTEKNTRIPAGAVLEGTEKLNLEAGRCFTVTAWVRMPTAPQIGDPLILGNKDWHGGSRPGFALIAARKTDRAKAPGVCLNYARSGDATRTDMGTFDVEPEKWTFYALTFTPNGTAYLFQGHEDGELYWIIDHAEDAVIATEMPWCLGQDGTREYPNSFNGDIDDFAIWTRSMTTTEIRTIFEAGRKGLTLADLLK